MKSFAERRAERIAELQASAAYEKNAPSRSPATRAPRTPVASAPSIPVAQPRRRTEPEPYELLRVGRVVLKYVLEALEDEGAPVTRRRVAAEMLRRELGGSR
jgi:hypothetical protein